MLLGERIKALRESEKLTQEDLGKICNVSKANISKYESNSIHPPLDTLLEIAKHFDVSTDYLLGFTNNKKEVLDVQDDYIVVLQSAKSKKISPQRLQKLIEFLDDQDNN